MMFAAYTPTVFTADEAGLERSHYVAWIEPFSLMADFPPYAAGTLRWEQL